MARNDKTFLDLYKTLLQLEFENEWKEACENNYINTILEHSSKNKNGKYGLPDFIYVNEKRKLLILVELKSNISQHEKEAIPQIKHYLSCFIPGTIESYGIISKEINESLIELRNWNILGLAISGDTEVDYGSRIDTFCIQIDKPIDMNINELLNEDDYIALFENLNLEEISSRISQASNTINNLLFDVKEDERPTLLSILLISLYQPKNLKYRNSFIDDFKKYDPKVLMKQIGVNIQYILGEDGENLPSDKIQMIINKYNSLANEKILQSSDVVKTILSILKDDVIPLFETKNNYDIIGKFYQEFLRYAGIVDVQSGIILTPEHVTELFTNLVDLKKDDVIFDSCCGTGSFLIAGMNKLLELQNSASEKEHVKRYQLIGNELKAHMYILAMSNMLFRGDGKSNLLNCDFFSKDFDKQFDEKIKQIGKNPTIGFINPPYSGSFTNYDELQKFKGNKNNKSKDKKPWMKEISFLEKMCRICTRYVVMIAPPQTFMGEDEIRNNLLKNNTIKAVINMPKDLFQPNASTGSSIIVIETNRKHDFNIPVQFYNLKKDGFELQKKKGRRDVYNKWANIKNTLLADIDAPIYRNPKNVDEINHCSIKIKNYDEWLIQAFSKVDFDKISSKDFDRTIKEYILYKQKQEIGILEKDINEVQLFELMESLIIGKDQTKKELNLSDKQFKEYPISEIFKIRSVKGRITRQQLVSGDYKYITTSNKNFGFSGYHNEYAEEGKVFTVDSATDGKSFYQTHKFIGSDHVEILEPLDKYKDKVNIYNALYIQTLLNYYLDKYEYSRKRAQKRIKKEYLYLPIKNQEIDWNFMEQYIKSLPYSEYI